MSARSRRQPSVLAFLAQDAEGRAFCYSNANIRKEEEAEEVLRFVKFWERTHGERPRHLVFDSKLTTYANLVKLDDMGIAFITLQSPESRDPQGNRQSAPLRLATGRTRCSDSQVQDTTRF